MIRVPGDAGFMPFTCRPLLIYVGRRRCRPINGEKLVLIFHRSVRPAGWNIVPGLPLVFAPLFRMARQLEGVASHLASQLIVTGSSFGVRRWTTANASRYADPAMKKGTT